MSTWFIARNKKKIGPIPFSKLKALAEIGQLLPSDHVLREGTEKWVQAHRVPGLFPVKEGKTIAHGARQEKDVSGGRKLWIGAAIGASFVVTLSVAGFLIFGGRETPNNLPPGPVAQNDPKQKKDTPSATTPNPAETKSTPVSPPDEKPKVPLKEPSRTTATLRAVMEKGVRVGGSARLEEVKRTEKTFDRSLDYAFQQTRFRIEIGNSTELGLKLGQTMMFIEMDGPGDQWEGVLAGFRLPDEPDLAKPQERWHYQQAYGLPTIESRYAGGRKFTAVGPVRSFDLMTVLNNTRWQEDSKEDVVPSDLPPGRKTSLIITFNRMSWLKEDSRQSLRLALPEITVAAKEGAEKYRILVHFKKSAADPRSWEVGPTEILPLDGATLEELISKNDLGHAILAANWWVERDSKAAFPALARRAETLTEGKLLHTILQLATRRQDSSVRGQARNLLGKPDTRLDVSVSAASYLAALGDDPDVSSLVAAAAGPDNEKAAAIIFTLGRLKTPGAVAGLRKLLANPSLGPRHPQIKSNLEFAEKLADKTKAMQIDPPPAESDQKPITIQYENRYHQVRATFSPDSKNLLVLHIFHGGTVEAAGMKIQLPPTGAGDLFDVATGRKVKKDTFETQFNGTFFDVLRGQAFAPDGKALAVAGSHMVGLFDLATGKLVREFGRRNDTMAPVAFSVDGKELLTCALGNKVVRWNRETGMELAKKEFKGLDSSGLRVFSPGGSRLAAAGPGKDIRWWDMVSGDGHGTLQGSSSPITDLAFSPDGIILVSGGIDRKATVWDLTKGQALANLAGAALYVAYAPNGQWIATGGAHSAAIWDAHTFKELATLPVPNSKNGFLNGMTFSPDSKILAIWDGDDRLNPQKAAVRITLFSMEKVLKK